MIKVAVAGGTGYTAGELIRILINHPGAEVISVLSTSSVGARISSVHRDLLGETELKFSGNSEFSEVQDRIEVLFLCLGHGLSKKFLDNYELSKECKIIDLGNDFRLESCYKDFEFVYGLSEFFKKEIKLAKYIANPGCFATAILLGLSPLALKKALIDDIHVHALTGSTGAGKSPSESTHFSYRSSNVSVYKPFTHQHLGEIEKNLTILMGSKVPAINFIPMRGDFARGIFASIYTKSFNETTLEEMKEYYQQIYKDSPFIFVSDESISLKEVVNTNKALIHIEKHNGYWHITTVIDNLLKGASGQAVQNMNLMSGLDENCGLHLKGSAF
ncbi:MAG: N-acetyl-gamma-glutamyl-phosphate reductase [Rikenellaceae bacterium]